MMTSDNNNPNRTTQAGQYRQNISFFDSSIFETSDAEKLAEYIRQKRGLTNAQRIFDDTPVNEAADRSFPIEINPVQEKSKAVGSLPHSAENVSSCLKLRSLEVKLKRKPSLRESCGKRMLLKEFVKAAEGWTGFEPAASSTPIIDEDPNILPILNITSEVETPESSEPNEIPNTANGFVQKITEDNHEAIAHQQEETLKNNNQVEKSNDDVTLVNNGVGTKQDKSQNISYSLRAKKSKSLSSSALSQQIHLLKTGKSIFEENVLERTFNSDNGLKSGDDERTLVQNKSRTKVFTSVEQNIKNIIDSSNVSVPTRRKENLEQSFLQTVPKEPSYSNIIKSANNFNKEDQNSNRKSTDRSTSNINHNLRSSAKVSSTMEIVQTSGPIATKGSSHSDCSSEDYENPVPEINVREHKNSENISADQRSSSRNLNSRKNKVKSFDCPAKSIQAITSESYDSDSSSKENNENSDENKNTKRIKGHKLSRIDPSFRRDFAKENEIPTNSAGHTTPRIEQNSKNVRVVSMDGRENPLIYMPIIQNFHELENGKSDKEKKCENSVNKTLMTRDVGCQNEMIGLITSDEDENATDKVLTTRKHNAKTKNTKISLRQSNKSNNSERKTAHICDSESGSPFSTFKSFDRNTEQHFNDKDLAGTSMQQNCNISNDNASQTSSEKREGRKIKRRLSQVDPIKGDYLEMRKKLKTTKIENVNVSRRRLYSEASSDNETLDCSNISGKLSQGTPIISHSKEETRKTLNFSKNPNEEVSNKTAQNIDSCDRHSNNERQFAASTSPVDSINKNDFVFKKPTKPVSKPPKTNDGKKRNQKGIAKGNSNNAMEESNPLISTERKRQPGLISRNKTVKTNKSKKATYKELDVPVEPDEFDYHPIEPVAISRTSVVGTNNNTETKQSYIAGNEKSMVRKTDKTKDKDSDAPQLKENKGPQHSRKRKQVESSSSSHLPSEELNEQLRRSSRQRKSPIAFWSFRLQNAKIENRESGIKTYNTDMEEKIPSRKKISIKRSKKALEKTENSENLKKKVTKKNHIRKDTEAKGAIPESQMVDEFDRLKASVSTTKSNNPKDPSNKKNVMKETAKLSENLSNKVPESSKTPPKMLHQEETASAVSDLRDDGFPISEENHFPKPPWSIASQRTPIQDYGKQADSTTNTLFNKRSRLFSWLQTLSTPRTGPSNTNIVQILHSSPIRIANAEDLVFQEVDGVEYAYYLGEDNNYGYLRFHPHSAKPDARAKHFELKFLPLVGSVQIKIHDNLSTIKSGDLVTVPKGLRYKISNPSNDPAVMFFIRTKTTM